MTDEAEPHEDGISGEPHETSSEPPGGAAEEVVLPPRADDVEGEFEAVPMADVTGFQDLPEHVIATSEFSGPLPSPQHLRDYEEILPGFAERLLTKYEAQAEHRQRLERMATRAEIASLFTGQVFAFALMGAALVFGYLLVDNGHALWGAGAFAAGIAPVAIHFLRRPPNRDDSADS